MTILVFCGLQLGGSMDGFGNNSNESKKQECAQKIIKCTINKSNEKKLSFAGVDEASQCLLEYKVR